MALLNRNTKKNETGDNSGGRTTMGASDIEEVARLLGRLITGEINEDGSPRFVGVHDEGKGFGIRENRDGAEALFLSAEGEDMEGGVREPTAYLITTSNGSVERFPVSPEDSSGFARFVGEVLTRLGYSPSEAVADEDDE